MEITTEYTQSCLVNPDIPQTMPGTNFTTIPIELIHMIFEYFTELEDFVKLSKVCRLFYYIVKNYKWSINCLNINFIPSNFQYVLSNFKHINHVYFNNLNENSLLYALEFVKTAKLVIDGTKFSSSSVTLSIFNILGKAKHVTFSNTADSIIDPNNNYYNLLKECEAITFENVLVFIDTINGLNNLENLYFLDFKDCRFDHPNALYNLYTENLGYFSINTKINHELLEVLLFHNPSIEYIDLLYPDYMPRILETLSSYERLLKLARMVLSDSWKYEELSISERGAFNVLGDKFKFCRIVDNSDDVEMID